jgi:SNF2 family DNA or RNA helicase
VIRGEVVLAGDGKAIEVVPRGDDRDTLQRALAAIEPAINARRAGTRLRLDFPSAARVAGELGRELKWSPEAVRAVENRRLIRDARDDVLAEVRRRQQLRPDEARALLPALPTVETLDDHQAINAAVMTAQRGWGACVFDEQGTGKTVTLIAAFDVLVERNEADVLLVAAPKSMVAEWSAEFRRFAGDLYRVAVADGTRAQKAASLEQGADVVVFNYETAVALRDNLRLLARRCRVVLAVDESYNVKNPDAQRSAAVADLREWCVRCFVLCGTPAPNAARDVVAQFDLMDLGLTFGNLKLDRDDPSLRDRMRDAMAARGVYTRNLKATVLPDLPARQFTEVAVDLAPEQRRLYEGALDGLVLDLQAATDVEFGRRIASFLERRNALLRICSFPGSLAPGYEETPAKIAALDGILERLTAEREKVVLWSFYRATLELLAERFSRHGLVRIDGSVGDTGERREAVRRFQEDDDTLIFLGNPAAAGAGLTLHRASVAIYESLSNQAAHFMQSLDRIHRRGQDRDVEYIVLLGRGTIDEREYRRLLGKVDAQADVLGDPVPDHPTRTLMLEELLELRRRLGET